MVRIFGDEDVGDRILGRDAAFDEARRRRRLHHHFLAGAAGVFGAAGDDHPELGGDDVEALAHVLPHHMQHPPATRAGLVRDVDEPFDPRQMGRQRSPVRPPRPGPSLALGLVSRFLARQSLSLDLLDVLERQKQLLLR